MSTRFSGILTAFAFFAFVHVGVHLHLQVSCLLVFPGFVHASCQTHIPYQPLRHDTKAQALKGWNASAGGQCCSWCAISISTTGVTGSRLIPSRLTSLGVPAELA